MEYMSRTLDLELDDLLRGAPAIAIDGPKGVGKTGTAARRARQVWLLDDPAQRERLRADFSLDTIALNGPVLFDEWQQLPQVWDSVRRAVDRGAAPGRFLLTGSATPIDASGTHSGAGRILSLRMRPMGLHERGMTRPTVSLGALLDGVGADLGGTTDLTVPDYVQAIMDSGFPGALGLSQRMRRSFLDSYLSRVIDRDLPDLGYEVRRPETLRRWLAAYAAASSQTTAYSRLLDAATGGDGAQPAKTTTIVYRDHLSRLRLLDPVPGWMPANSPFTTLRQAPKHQLADPALAVRLLRLTEPGLMAPGGAGVLGHLFESLVTLGVRVMAQAADATVSHLRTKAGGHEVDLIVESADGGVLGIEVKLAPVIEAADVRHLLWLRDRMPEKVVDLLVVTTGQAAYRRRDGVAVVPLALLGP
ncbi:ATP-binding protein [Actinomyces provencensis]|uniref:ATP-binding protein n=1 Tax=Actinomyces provencensis TaxID=1720198 RepID=UPI00096A3914|nr:DUF4143 domain-containing protein [Actinomyces provencensis]